MTDPVVVPITKGSWVKVASSVNNLRLWRIINNTQYLYTSRDARNAAPASIAEGVVIFVNEESEFEDKSFKVLSDVYIWCKNDDGSIRVDNNAGVGAASATNLNTKVPVDNFAIQQNGIATTLLAPTIIDAKQIQVTDPSTFSIGDVVVITNPQSIYFGEALAVVGDIITLDSKTAFAYSAGDTAQSYTKDMNVDGSVTPQVFSIFGPGASVVELNVTRLIWNALTTAAVDLSKFGDIAGGLLNGCLLRGVPNPASGVAQSNQFNIKTNADFDTVSGGDFKPASATNPAQGQDGFTTRYTYGNPDKHDTIPCLSVGDRIDFIINDDLTTLLLFRMLFGGNTEFLL